MQSRYNKVIIFSLILQVFLNDSMKMNLGLKMIVAAAFSALVLTACSDDDFGDAADNANIEGRVWTQNEFGQPLYEERSGITVFLQTGFRNFNLAGDQVGRYRLEEAPIGTYTARYSKPGFGTIERRGIRVNANSPVLEVIAGFQQFPSVTITKLPTTTFSNLSASLEGQQSPFALKVSGNLVPPPPPTGQAKGYRVFVGTASDVSRDSFVFQKHYSSTTAGFENTIGQELFSQVPGSPGSVLFVRVYGDANFDESYTDQTGKVNFPNLSTVPSDVLSVVLP